MHHRPRPHRPFPRPPSTPTRSGHHVRVALEPNPREHMLSKSDYYTRRCRHSSIEFTLESLNFFFDINYLFLDNPTGFLFTDAPSYD
ncbi:hypothetical protein K466DRAFT_271812 [Polyporus arcularius HHB13444]|uniref:Uncharacterized protein n=1 Tax=Polyporus arcularius HHB13444 TaxID=1314778 RepID=A0A5C3PBG2_9APHY|nr:hypothetical protein K466DRAFT_271812 [Polyporus arcularius HHB13444]